jgi:hypothetical protein
MNLYRLDSASGPVTNLMAGGPALYRAWRTARYYAQNQAILRSEDVTITRISGAGLMRAVATASPDGAIHRV